MKMRKAITRTIAAAGMSAAMLLGPAALPAQAADPWTCPSGENPSVWNPALTITAVPAVYVWNRKIELRYHRSTRCAWGRISNGNWGDQIWVDWVPRLGEAWRQLGVTSIPIGGTQVYTTAYNDRDHAMRACGKAGDRPEIACTGWY